jgi:hypothetical protein
MTVIYMLEKRLSHNSGQSTQRVPARMVSNTSNKRNDIENGGTQEPPSSSASEKERLTKLIPAALAEQKFHLPGNLSWWQDWLQYFCNNHPIFSLFLHHRLHPVGQGMRLIGLAGSIVFGLAITNVIWLLLIYDSDDADAFVISVSSSGSIGVNNQTVVDAVAALSEENENIRGSSPSVQVNAGMLVLWTLGSFLQTIFDTTIWTMTSGLCCQTNNRLVAFLLHPENQRFGNYFVVLLVILVAGASSLIAVVRITLTSGSGGTVPVSQIHSLGLTDDAVDITQVKDVSNYEFLLSYAVELGVAYLVYFPIVQTILFSGILACGRPIRFLGGRVYELREEEKTAKNHSGDCQEDTGKERPLKKSEFKTDLGHC